jgi:hypothetical protein
VKAVLFGKDNISKKERRQKVSNAKSQKVNVKMQKSGNAMSIADQRAMLKNYNKVKAEKEAVQAKERAAKKEAKKKGRSYRPGPAKTPYCAYCKTEGHWMRNRGEIVCPKLVAKNAYVKRKNERRRESGRVWRSDASAEVERETGVGGWNTVGEGVLSMGEERQMDGEKKDDRKKKYVNPFDMGDGDVSEDEEVEEVPAVVSGEAVLCGAWASPLKTEEKEVVVEKVSAGLRDYNPGLSWGDQ